MRVLIIDDDANIRRMMRLTLESEHEVHDAGSGAEALLVLAAGDPFDVVIVDQKMPGASGLQLIPDIRRLAPRSSVVMVTAYASIDLAAEALRAGARHFLSKPLTPEMLRAAVHSAGRDYAGAAESASTIGSADAITLNGFRIDLAGEPVEVERDGSAVHSFIVTHAFSDWSQPVRVTIGSRAFRQSAYPDLGAGSIMAHGVAAQALATYLFKEGMLPEGGAMTIDEVAPADLTAAARALKAK